MKHIRSGDLAQAKPNQKALHPRMWSQAHLYTTPQPDRVAELEAALKVARDALNDCEGALDECRDYPITYDTILETLAKINEVLHD